MVEVDWGIIYLGQALGLGHLPVSTNLGLTTGILSFTVLYVLWGGYQSAVETDRAQVPLAYIGFTVFGLAVGVYGLRNEGPGAGFLLSFVFGVMAFLIVNRLRTLRIGYMDELTPEYLRARLSAVATFGPLLILSFFAVVYAMNFPEAWSADGFYSAIAPAPGERWIGFNGFALIALLAVNAIWQFVDISSLQRLQSVSARDRIPGILRRSGIEAGLGWLLIVIVAIMLRAAGFSHEEFLKELWASADLYWLVPLFVFVVFVYMLSTISGFVSALSYIAFYDLAPVLAGGKLDELSEQDPICKADKLRHPRSVTVAVIAVMLLLYSLLRSTLPPEKIASALYAIYAFQIAILPALLSSFFSQKALRASAVVASVVAGIVAAYLSAAHWIGSAFADLVSLDEADWQVMPPFVAATAAAVTLHLWTKVQWRVPWVRAAKRSDRT
jgi:hypothetical protein